MLARPSPFNDDNTVCDRCHRQEVRRLSEQSSEIVGITMPSASSSVSSSTPSTNRKVTRENILDVNHLIHTVLTHTEKVTEKFKRRKLNCDRVDEEIPQETRNNNLIICYDLVKIWKLPFKNPYKEGEFYKIGKEKEFHTIDGVKDRMDCKKNTWLVGVIFAEKIDGNKLQWKWNPKKEYAECYNLAETEIEIKIRTKRGAPDEFSISMDTHDILRTLDGYDDSGG